uniref:Transposase n=1 Tax=Streptomyces sp. NBC_00049 TaxID=2903617 RepID=A0AAU2JZL4_9ACTN
MKTCPRFTRIRSDFERDIRYLGNHAARHPGTAPAKTSARTALGTKQRMAEALTRHYAHCPECG